MIQPTSNLLGFHRTDATTSSTPAKQPASAVPASGSNEERLSSSSTQALREALSSSPEIRPEVVERGRALAVDPNYPPRELILRLAKLMTQSQDPSEQA